MGLSAFSITGLSPRVRGNHPAAGKERRFVGSIPARAGEPPDPSAGSGHGKVYPRACGGTMYTASTVLGAAGLSPRVRGNPAPCYPIPVCPGSIPARAGEPSFAVGSPSVYLVYPRACGGTRNTRHSRSGSHGLSPRVRGNRPDLSGRSGDYGSIPARAGEPRWKTSGCIAATVYPRACGGTAAARIESYAKQRSIPARAGEPCPRAHRQGVDRVYPRACGGTVLMTSPDHYDSGLSPRVRGNRPSSRCPASGSRSIPARAGEPRRLLMPDQPGGGLSPRVRGNRMAETTFIDLLRSIPARAGEPHPIHIFRYPIKVYPRACGGTMYRA